VIAGQWFSIHFVRKHGIAPWIEGHICGHDTVYKAPKLQSELTSWDRR
jgi:hypothetical protein